MTIPTLARNAAMILRDEHVDASFAKLNAMSSAWDEAAAALKRRDCDGFDRAMVKFNEEKAR